MLRVISIAATLLTLVAATTARADVGDLGSACYPNDTCNGKLACKKGVCSVAEGGRDQPCYGNDTCDSGHACVAKTCVKDTSLLAECREPDKSAYATCVSRAAEVLARSYSSATGHDRAESVCQGVRDPEVARVAYSYLGQQQSDATAMEMAVKWSRERSVQARAPIIDYAAGVYDASYSPVSAVERALQKAGTVGATALECLKEAVAAYSSYSSHSAMDQAFEKCSKREPAPRCR